MMTMTLPEGVYEKGGKLYRDAPRMAQLIVHDDGSQEEVHDWIPREVILPLATDSASVEQARLKAVAQSERGVPTDFLHPIHGWLRHGKKREIDDPDNLGNGQVVYRRTSTVVPVAVDAPPERKEKANGTR